MAGGRPPGRLSGHPDACRASAPAEADIFEAAPPGSPARGNSGQRFGKLAAAAPTPSPQRRTTGWSPEPDGPETVRPSACGRSAHNHRRPRTMAASLPPPRSGRGSSGAPGPTPLPLPPAHLQAAALAPRWPRRDPPRARPASVPAVRPASPPGSHPTPRSGRKRTDALPGRGFEPPRRGPLPRGGNPLTFRCRPGGREELMLPSVRFPARPRGASARLGERLSPPRVPHREALRVRRVPAWPSGGAGTRSPARRGWPPLRTRGPRPSRGFRPGQDRRPPRACSLLWAAGPSQRSRFPAEVGSSRCDGFCLSCPWQGQGAAARPRSQERRAAAPSTGFRSPAVLAPAPCTMACSLDDGKPLPSYVPAVSARVREPYFSGSGHFGLSVSPNHQDSPSVSLRQATAYLLGPLRAARAGGHRAEALLQGIWPKDWGTFLTVRSTEARKRGGPG